MIAQYNKSKLETVLYTYVEQRKKWRRRRGNLISGIIQSLKDRNGKLQQINFTLTFCLTLLENQLFTEKRIDLCVVFLEVVRFGGKVFGAVTHMIALNKPFVFLVPHLRLYYLTYDTNL